MKNLEEKKLLVKMMRAFGQPVDPELLESIEKEEKLSAMLFGGEKVNTPVLKPVSKRVQKTVEIQVPVEPPVVEANTEIEPVVIDVQPEIVSEIAVPEPLSDQPEKPAETGVMPPEDVRVKQVADYISAVSKLPAETNTTSDLEEVKKTIADLLKKVNTLSWGGGGTGIVNIGQADDFDKNSYGEGYTMRWINGKFRLDPHGGGGAGGGNWILKTENYTAVDNDKIIADTTIGPFVITLPPYPITGDEVTIMDGNDWSLNPITIARNGNTIEGISDDMYSDNKGALITLVYNGNVGVETWQVASTSSCCQVQPDWNQADTTSADYIKNKPWLWMDSNNHIVVGATMVPSNSVSIGTPDQPFADSYFGAHSISIMSDSPTGNTIVLENVNDTLGVTSGGFGVKDPTQTFYNFKVEYGGYSSIRTANPVPGRAVLELSANPSANIIPLVSTVMGGAIHTTGGVYGPTLNTLDNFDNVNPYNFGNAIVFRRFRGSVDAPTAVQTNDRLGSVAAAGYGGSTTYSPTGLPPTAQNSMIFRASEAHTVSAHGANVEFWAVPNTTNVAVQLVTLNPSGSNSGIVLNQAGSGITFGDGTFQNTAFQIPKTITVTNNYTMLGDDYYVGVNIATSSTVTLPSTNVYNGRRIVIKDESGHCSTNPITVSAPVGSSIDNDSSAIMRIDNMALTMIYNNGWRII